MSTTNQTNDLMDFNDGQAPQMSSTINVLTVLTMIWSVIALIMGLWNYVSVEKSYKQMIENRDKMEQAPAWVKKMMGPEMMETMRKTVENKLPIMLLTVVGCALCFWGALEMRKLKKQGFILWAAGEFLPVIGIIIFIGMGAFSGFSLIGLVFPILFLILYATQRKNLVY
jgi:hypothetical protein